MCPIGGWPLPHQTCVAPNVGHTHDWNSVVANPRASSTSSSSSSTHLDKVSATTLSAPFRCAIWKSKLCSRSDHRARRPLMSFMVINHLRLAWSVITVNGISSTYGRNFSTATLQKRRQSDARSCPRRTGKVPLRPHGVTRRTGPRTGA
ncbi:hypothetical protein KR032_010720 [Drosophila birchii]|nr:hypothetical protein KR032_010720 [Drosophila birchii]